MSRARKLPCGPTAAATPLWWFQNPLLSCASKMWEKLEFVVPWYGYVGNMDTVWYSTDATRSLHSPSRHGKASPASPHLHLHIFEVGKQQCCCLWGLAPIRQIQGPIPRSKNRSKAGYINAEGMMPWCLKAYKNNSIPSGNQTWLATENSKHVDIFSMGKASMKIGDVFRLGSEVAGISK